MNERIQQTINLTKQVLGDARNRGQNVCCSVSGGADSDILIDLCERAEPHFVSYVFFDTGIEYLATKEHLNWLEQKYGIKIHREKAKVPVPLGNQKYGLPFLSKRVSNMISRLQNNNFQWKDEKFEVLYSKYPKCKAALKWWCNEWGDKSSFNISQNSWLKEFIIKNPPKFKISDRCCEGAKKDTSDNFIKKHPSSIQIIGVRKSEGGVRTMVYNEPLSYNVKHKMTHFFPILFFTDQDRQEYEQEFGVSHSKCYTQYGLHRTGCCGCPYGRNCNFEREVLKKYEPKLYKAIENMWSEVYDYTDKYHEFQKIMNRKYKEKKKCVCGCTEFTGDDVAMNLKYFGHDVKTLLCRGCFQNIMEMTDEQWDNTIEEFKAQGCQLF